MAGWGGWLKGAVVFELEPCSGFPTGHQLLCPDCRGWRHARIYEAASESLGYRGGLVCQKYCRGICFGCKQWEVGVIQRSSIHPPELSHPAHSPTHSPVRPPHTPPSICSAHLHPCSTGRLLRPTSNCLPTPGVLKVWGHLPPSGS